MRGGKRLAFLGCAAIAVTLMTAAILWRSWRASPEADARPWELPEAVPLAQVALPAGAPGGLRGALEEFARLYAEGREDASEAVMARICEELRALKVVPGEALGTYHIRTVAAALQRNDPAEAERRAVRWLALAPDDVDHNFLLGQIRHQGRRWSGAVECFRRVVARRPQLVDAQRWLAQACAQMGAQEEGLRAARASLRGIGFPEGEYWTQPLADLVLRNAIFVFHRFQDYESLHEVAGAYRTRFAVKHEAIMADGVALSSLGRYEEAEPLLRQALADPLNQENSDEISFELALCLTKSSQWGEAARFLAQLLARNPFHAKAYHQLALVLDRLGRKPEAEALRRKSRELAPSERELRREKELRGAGHTGRGAAAASRGYALRGEHGRAEQVLRAPDLRTDPFAVFALADYYLSTLRVLDMEKVLEHAVTLVGEGHPDIAGRRGLGLLARGDSERGFAELRAAAGRAADPVWKLHLARELVLAGLGKEALEVLEPLRKGDDDREASYLLGRALLEVRDAARASQLFASISTADTRFEEWEVGSWHALAIFEAKGPLADAQRLLEAVPASSRSSRACLQAQLLALQAARRGDPELAAARKALEAHDSVQPSISSTSKQVASQPWTESGGLRLALAKLHAARGELKQAVRHAELSLIASPGSLDALRALEGWLRDEADVFLRLRALRAAAALAPGDPGLRAEVSAIESRWLK